MFRGAGKDISEDERSSRRKHVHVFFQENTWVDSQVAVDWVNKTLNLLQNILKKSIYYNHEHNILRLFDTLPNFPFTTSESSRDY